MPIFRRQILMSAFRAADVAVMAIAFAIAMAASAERMSIDFQDFLAVRIKFSNILLFVGFAVLWHLIFISQGLYRSRRIGLIKVEWWDVTGVVAWPPHFVSRFLAVAQIQHLLSRFSSSGT